MKTDHSKDHDVGSVKEAARTLAQDAAADAVELAGDLGHLKDEILKAVQQALVSVRDGTTEKAGELYEQARDRSSQAVKSLGQTVKRNPMASIAVAAGIGVVLGLYLRRRR